MKDKIVTLYDQDGTKKLLASLISILIGLLVGGLLVIVVGLFNERITLKAAFEGFRLIFAGIYFACNRRHIHNRLVDNKTACNCF